MLHLWEGSHGETGGDGQPHPRKEEAPKGMESLELDKGPRAGGIFLLSTSHPQGDFHILGALPWEFWGSIGVCFHIK